MGKKEDNEENLMFGFEAFADKFRPAISIKDSDVQMSSFDLCTMFTDFAMITVTGGDLLTLMRENGYICEMIEKRLMWLLKSVK